MFPPFAPLGGPVGGPFGNPFAGPPGVPRPNFPDGGLPRLPGMGGLPLPFGGGIGGGPPLQMVPGPPIGGAFGSIPLRRRRRMSAAPRGRPSAPGPIAPQNLAAVFADMNLNGQRRGGSHGRMFDPTQGGARRRPESRGRSPGDILRNVGQGQGLGRGRSCTRSLSRGRTQFRRRRSVHFPDGIDYNENFGAPGEGQRQSYEKIKSLGVGGMSEAVNLMRGRSDGKLYVEKRIVVNILQGRRARAEIETLKIVRGQHHLNQLVEYKMLHNGRCSMILEYCDGGSLSSRIVELAKRGSNLNSAAIWNIIMGVARGLAYLHDGIENVHAQTSRREAWDPICHLDLKPCNIFIHSQGGEDGHQRIVLADFGCCITLSDIKQGCEQEHLQECGTPEWYPPEGQTRMLRRGLKTGYGTKTDMYMLGATTHVSCRLLSSPNSARLRSDNPCGSRYANRNLNGIVKMLCQDDFGKRPPAREVAVLAKKMVQQFTQR